MNYRKCGSLLTLSLLLNALVLSETEDSARAPDSSPMINILNKILNLFYSRGKWDFLDIVRMFESILSGSSLLRHSRLHDNGTREDTGNQTQDWTQKVSLRSRTEQREQRDCLTDIYRLFENVTENPWALQFLDSWGKPGPSLLMGRIRFVGNYKQCRSAMAPPLPDEPGSGFKGNYCVLNIAVKGVSGHVGLIGNLELGSCMPDSCTESEITDIVQEKLKTFNLSSELSAGSTECRTDKREVTGATAASILLLTVILILMVSGTLLDIVVLQCPKWNSQCQDQDRAEPGGENNFKPHIKYCQISMETDLSEEEQTEKEDSLAGSVRSRVEKTVIERRASLLTKRVHFKTPWRGLLVQTLLAFSVYTNGSKVLNTSQPPGSLSVIHGIRFLSMSWVILGHIYNLGMANILNSIEEAYSHVNSWTFDIVTNAFLAVDTFFTLSGLLVAYVTTNLIQQGCKMNWRLFYFHRFWRLTPPYMLTLLFVLGLQRFMGSGALWPTLVPEDKNQCEANWWTNLLYINNFVGADKPCFSHSWYLANDIQFYILSPLMLIPFFYNVCTGLVSCAMFLSSHWILTGILSMDNNWSPTFIRLDVKSADDVKGQFGQYYIRPYCRIGPYIIGIMAGYLLSVRKGHVQMNKITVISGWVFSAAISLSIVYGIHGDITAENKSSVGVAALYNAVARSVWGACVSWVIIACSSGYGGPVTALLSWKPFVVLSRLTFMAYLVHPSVIMVYLHNQEALYASNDVHNAITYLGLMVIIYMVSFLLMLALESPVIALDKVWLRNSRKVVRDVR